jgi:hypothetical protein
MNKGLAWWFGGDRRSGERSWLGYLPIHEPTPRPSMLRRPFSDHPFGVVTVRLPSQGAPDP